MWKWSSTFCCSDNFELIWADWSTCKVIIDLKLRSSFRQRKHWCLRSSLIYLMILNWTSSIWSWEISEKVWWWALTNVVIQSWWAWWLNGDWAWSARECDCYWWWMSASTVSCCQDIEAIAWLSSWNIIQWEWACS